MAARKRHLERLQVVVGKDEAIQIRRLAKREQLSVSKMLRRVIFAVLHTQLDANTVI